MIRGLKGESDVNKKIKSPAENNVPNILFCVISELLKWNINNCRK